jgi:uncharacterized spore protein YtfJ
MMRPTTPRDPNRRVTTETSAQSNAAGKISGFIAWLIAVLSLMPVIQVRATANDFDPPSRELIEELKQLYATEITLGKPLEIDGLKIIPLAAIGVGFGQRIGAPDCEVLRGAGGALSRVGILVISNKGIELLPVSKGFIEQVLAAVTPVILQIMKAGGTDVVDTPSAAQARVSLSELLAIFYAFVPEHGLKFGLFP